MIMIIDEKMIKAKNYLLKIDLKTSLHSNCLPKTGEVSNYFL